MYVYKRKRSTSSGVVPRAYKRPRTVKRFRPGYDRRVGLYGRFQPGGAELKFYDLTNNASKIPQQGGTVISFNNIVQGTGQSQRIGRKITIRSLHSRFRFFLNPVSATPPDVVQSDTVRLIWYVDKQMNGSPASVSDILASPDYQSDYNLSNKSRFRILKDVTYTLNPTGITENTTSGTQKTAEMSVNKEFKMTMNLPIEFSGTMGTNSEIRSNNIGAVTISRRGANSGLEAFTRIRYSDL